MPKITITISQENLQRYVQAIKTNHPIPRNENGKPKYTDGKWARMRLKRLMAREVFIAEKNAEVSNVIEDTNLVNVE